MNERPRGALFRDPQAEVVWAAICALDEAAQHELLAQLRRRLNSPAEREGREATQVARAVSALRACAEALGRSPSVEQYRAERKTNPSWPPDSSLRRWLGGHWNEALKRAGLDAVPDHLAVAPSLGPAFTQEEAIAALLECRDELDRVPASTTTWAGSVRQRSAVDLDGGRRPRTSSNGSLAAGWGLSSLRVWPAR